MIPGFTGSSPGHWQSLWEREHPEYRRVEQRDWDHPDRDEWVNTLDRAVQASAGPVVLAGHSLGCLTIVRWALAFGARSVRGAFLVAPSDVEAPQAPVEVRGFAPVPLGRLPFPSVVIASDDDPLVSLERAKLFSTSWGSRFVSIGSAGHIHTAAGYGPWPEGHQMLRRLVDA